MYALFLAEFGNSTSSTRGDPRCTAAESRSHSWFDRLAGESKSHFFVGCKTGGSVLGTKACGTSVANWNARNHDSVGPGDVVTSRCRISTCGRAIRMIVLIVNQILGIVTFTSLIPRHFGFGSKWVRGKSGFESPTSEVCW